MMLLSWIVGLIAIATFIVTGFADSLSGKSKSSTYFQKVQTPAGKDLREANIPDPSEYDPFFSHLNAQ
ncbi:hypothetical protein ACHOLT_14570 [Desulfitobacterium sp. Sab5]|uniref:hypothetical protein n=1 Tax=Desulfitobacterium nosdiversum TaxID=3375356 RepID=UPI003CEF4EA0